MSPSVTHDINSVASGVYTEGLTRIIVDGNARATVVL